MTVAMVKAKVQMQLGCFASVMMHRVESALLLAAVVLQEEETHLVPLDSHMTSAVMPFSCMSLFITASASTDRHTLLSLTNRICA